jgi:hypothetical protein
MDWRSYDQLVSRGRPTEVPASPPTYFPSDLWPQTNVILLEARQKYPTQAQTFELCKHVVSKLTPVFCEAVKAGKMKAEAVQRENGGGMEDLLHSLLIYNDSGIRTGFGLSDQAYRLGQEVRKSDEWLGLAKAISEVEGKGPRTGTDQAESSLDAQNSLKTAQGLESKAADRRSMVNAYIEEVRIKTGKRIARKEIWTKAGYNSRTEFERWERKDSNHPNKTADEIFTRLLSVEKPHLK